MQRPSLFLDDGGVMNDNALRGPRRLRLAAAFFLPRRDGDPAAWAAVNRRRPNSADAAGGEA